MITLHRVFIALCAVFVLSPFMLGSASAGECERPVGDPVEQITVRNEAYWFGKARAKKVVIDITVPTTRHIQNQSRLIEFEPIEVYLSNVPEGIEAPDFVHVSAYDFENGALTSEDLSGRDVVHDFFFVFDTDEARWAYGGPGACKQLRRKHWRGLAAGDYNL